METEFDIPAHFDPLFKQAAALVIANPLQVSTSLFHFRLKVGRVRADKIMDELEEAGVVAPPKSGSIYRAVLIKSMDDLEVALKRMNTINNNSFPYNYYLMLKDLRNEISDIEKKLCNNLNLTNGTKSDISKFILSDLGKIYKILYNEDYVKHKLEGFGVVLLAAYLLKCLLNSDFDPLNEMKYSDICSRFDEGGFDDLITSVLTLIKASIVDITITADGNGVTCNITKPDGNNNTLVLPSILKISNNELYSELYAEYATILYRYAVTLVKADGVQNVNESAKLKNIYNILYNTQPNHNADTIIKEHIGNDTIKEQNVAKLGTSNSIVSNETLDDILNELNNDIIGLTSVKKEVNSLVNLINVQKQRQKAGLPVQPLSYHLVFTGNPGTGKTTIARMISKIYKHLGILKNGALIETDRAGLIAEYVGQTASKVNKVVDSALNNVLFIDEAYSLVSEGSEDYGKEAVATLIKRMEDDRDKLVLIIAGYTNEMKKFIDTNPGFKSRLNKFIEFDDYTPYELYQIFELQCKKLKFNLSTEAIEKVKSIFSAAYQQRDKSFGNGRFARNFFENVQQEQANRIASTPTVDLEVLTTIKLEDIPDA